MKVIILAAGKGSRINSTTDLMPKVLREVKGKALLSYVIEKLPPVVRPADVHVVVGFMKEKVISHIGPAYSICEQTEQLGTGHAVAICREAFASYDGPVMVLYGDMPCFRRETYQGLLDAHLAACNDATVLVCDAPPSNIPPYGRVILDGNAQLADIVEEKDCTEAQKKITLLNVGAYVFDSKKLFSALSRIRNDNAQGEYYLPDVPKVLKQDGSRVAAYTIYDINESIGVNTFEDLAACERMI